MSATGAVRLFCTSASAFARISNSSMWAFISFLRSADGRIVSCDVCMTNSFLYNVSKLYRDLYMVSTDIRKPPEVAPSGGFRASNGMLLSFLPIGIIAYANGKSKDSFFERFYAKMGKIIAYILHCNVIYVTIMETGGNVLWKKQLR